MTEIDTGTQIIDVQDGTGKVIRRTYAIHQLMSMSLYDDDPALDSFQRTMVRHMVAQRGGELDGEPRIAYSFGKVQHVGHDENDNVHGQECVELGCEIVGCERDEATVAFMRIEFELKGDVDA